jgi:hypothetical protein
MKIHEMLLSAEYTFNEKVEFIDNSRPSDFSFDLNEIFEGYDHYELRLQKYIRKVSIHLIRQGNKNAAKRLYKFRSYFNEEDEIRRAYFYAGGLSMSTYHWGRLTASIRDDLLIRIEKEKELIDYMMELVETKEFHKEFKDSPELLGFLPRIMEKFINTYDDIDFSNIYGCKLSLEVEILLHEKNIPGFICDDRSREFLKSVSVNLKTIDDVMNLVRLADNRVLLKDHEFGYFNADFDSMSKIADSLEGELLDCFLFSVSRVEEFKPMVVLF